MFLDRVGIHIGPFDIFGITFNPTIHWYGLILVSGMLAAAALVARLAKREGKDPDHVWGGLTWAIGLGIIGARLWFVLFPPITAVEAGRTTQWFLEHFFDLNQGPLVIWSGGLSIFGGAIGGFIGILIYLRRNKQSLWSWMDLVAIGLPLGQAIGRWGNFVNQELYGAPTSLPWGIPIDSFARAGAYRDMATYPPETLFHPLFLYESIWSLLTCLVLLTLWRYRRDRLKWGDILLIYLVMYSGARFLLEFLRVEVSFVGNTGINSSQAITAIGFVAALAGLIYQHSPGGSRGAGLAEPAADKPAGQAS